MKQNGVVCKPGPAHLFFIFRFEYLISGPKSYRDFRETSPRAVPDKLQKASVKEVVVDNSTNNSSFNINKISLFGKGKYCFSGPRDRQVKHYYLNKKAVTLSIGFGQKEFLSVQRNQQSFF